MLEKNLYMSTLLDFYGDLLSERKRDVLDLHYNEDYSLSEISEHIGISRQGVRDIIVKTEIELMNFEDKLSFVKRINKAKEDIDSLINDLSKQENNTNTINTLKNISETLITSQ